MNGSLGNEGENTGCLVEKRATRGRALRPEEFKTIAALKAPAAANGIPAINVVPSCRAAAGGDLGLYQSMDACLADEKNAHDQVAEQWNQFPHAERSSCVSMTTTGGGGTYTELLTCLEMKQFARNLPKSDTAVILAAR